MGHLNVYVVNPGRVASQETTFSKRNLFSLVVLIGNSHHSFPCCNCRLQEVVIITGRTGGGWGTAVMCPPSGVAGFPNTSSSVAEHPGVPCCVLHDPNVGFG